MFARAALVSNRGSGTCFGASTSLANTEVLSDSEDKEISALIVEIAYNAWFESGGISLAFAGVHKDHC